MWEENKDIMTNYMFKNLGFLHLLDYLHWEYEIRQELTKGEKEARELDEENKTLENMKAEGQK